MKIFLVCVLTLFVCLPAGAQTPLPIYYLSEGGTHAGNTPYHCSIHPSMIGAVTVIAASTSP